jgi:agmatine/peptidylarginine deiminase
MFKLRNVLIICFLSIIVNKGFAQEEKKSLPHKMTSEEQKRAHEIGKDFYETDPPPGEIRPIAEYEPMESVLIRYPFGIPMDFIATLSEEILVTTIVEDQSEENTVMNQYENNGVNTDNVTFIHAPTDSYWTRDYGPWYIEYGNHQIGIVNFPYNRPRPGDNDIPIVVADSLNLDLFGMNLIHTGGNYMADGVNSAASTTLVEDENPDYTISEINNLVNNYLGVSNYHLNEDPLGDYIEHIDCWGKFLDVDKILIGQVPESDSRYEDFEAVADYYANTTSAWGTPYEVYRVYTPGDYPYTPYTNSLILNDRVFVPLTGNEWDDEAIATYEEAMPGYEIIGVQNSAEIWQNTDALHCRTHEMADRGMLKIKHTPLLGEIENQDSYNIQAEIIPFSGETVYEDSLRVYYKTNDQTSFSHITMQNTGNYTYEASISVPGGNNEVYYYIHAADHSGRSENHPYIGAPDPHYFYEVDPPPELTVKDTTIYLSQTGEISISEEDLIIEASGACTLVDTSLSQYNFNCSDLGTNNINVTVEDCNGQTTSKTSVVTVNDSIAPMLTVKDTSLSLDENGNASLSEMDLITNSSDNCSIENYTLSQNNFSCNNVGIVNIEVTATDAGGNTTSKPAAITVEDNFSPLLTTQDIVLELDSNGTAEIVPADVIQSASDNCQVIDTTLSQSTFNSAGNYFADVTVEDNHGNSTSKTTEVNILNNEPPTLSVKNSKAYLDSTGHASISVKNLIEEASDNNTVADTLISGTTEFTCADAGSVFYIEITLKDDVSNTTTKTANIEVEDTIAPLLTIKNITIQLDETGNASITANDVIENATDNCGLSDTTLSQINFTTEDIGMVNIDVIVSDVNGNSTSKTAEINVNEQTDIIHLAKNKIQIYPNPADSKLKITSKNLDIKRLTIIEPTGKILYSTKSFRNRDIINLEKYNSGIYFIRIETDKGIVIRKIIKK